MRAVLIQCLDDKRGVPSTLSRIIKRQEQLEPRGIGSIVGIIEGWGGVTGSSISIGYVQSKAVESSRRSSLDIACPVRLGI